MFLEMLKAEIASLPDGGVGFALGVLVAVVSIACFLLPVAVVRFVIALRARPEDDLGGLFFLPRKQRLTLEERQEAFKRIADVAVAVTVAPALSSREPKGRLFRRLETIAFFIPRSVRDPFWEHLLEDRDRMVSEGRSPVFIFWAIASQFGWLLCLGARDAVLSQLFGVPKLPKD
jgi:hypothetical protein